MKKVYEVHLRGIIRVDAKDKIAAAKIAWEKSGKMRWQYRSIGYIRQDK